MKHPASENPLPSRSGPRPATTPSNPHSQLDQNAPEPMQRALAERIFALDCVEERPSGISVPGARALCLCADCVAGDPSAFMVGREFAHLHPPCDGSLHAALPPGLAQEAIARGWSEVHPVARRGLIAPNVVMIFGPRDETELEVVTRLIIASRDFASARSEAGDQK